MVRRDDGDHSVQSISDTRSANQGRYFIYAEWERIEEKTVDWTSIVAPVGLVIMVISGIALVVSRSKKGNCPKIRLTFLFLILTPMDRCRDVQYRKAILAH